MRKLTILSIAFGLVLITGYLTCVEAQRRKKTYAVLCPDPTIPCKTSFEFKPHQLPFQIPETAVIWETEAFYAIILKSVRNPNDNCDIIVPEAERLDAQNLFPRHKVFATRCYDPEELYYTNTGRDYQFMAVYAGRSRAEATKMLARVKATGKFPGANLRLMRSGFNGT